MSYFVLDDEDDLQTRKISKSNFTIGEFIKKRFRVTLHQGSFGDTLINVLAVKVRPDRLMSWKQNKHSWVSALQERALLLPVTYLNLVMYFTCIQTNFCICCCLYCLVKWILLESLVVETKTLSWFSTSYVLQIETWFCWQNEVYWRCKIFIISWKN